MEAPTIHCNYVKRGVRNNFMSPKKDLIGWAEFILMLESDYDDQVELGWVDWIL